MFSNRELFASVTLESLADVQAEEDKTKKAKAAALKTKQESDAKHVIHCMKRALSQSMSLTPMRDTLRPLDSSTDFSMVTRVDFDGVKTRRERPMLGANCCASVATREDEGVDRRREMEGDGTLRPVRSSATFSAAGSGRGGHKRGASGGGGGGAAGGGGGGGGGAGASGGGGDGASDAASPTTPLTTGSRQSPVSPGAATKRGSIGGGGGGGSARLIPVPSGGSGLGGSTGGEDNALLDEDDDDDDEASTSSDDDSDNDGGGAPRGAAAGTSGTNIDPANSIPFVFMDFAPMCYRHIRNFFGIEPRSFLKVLCESTWHSIPTPGKSSAQLFFVGRNWVIKTMTNGESDFLTRILHRYYYHVRDNPHTLLPHFLGHHRLAFTDVDGADLEFTFVIMQNVFATPLKIHTKFDLKGSTIGRFATAAEKKKATCTQKDLDVNKPLRLGEPRRSVLMEQLRRDCDFLRRSEIMDYSFLIGIHDISTDAQHNAVAAAAAAAAAAEQQAAQYLAVNGGGTSASLMSSSGGGGGGAPPNLSVTAVGSGSSASVAQSPAAGADLIQSPIIEHLSVGRVGGSSGAAAAASSGQQQQQLSVTRTRSASTIQNRPKFAPPPSAMPAGTLAAAPDVSPDTAPGEAATPGFPGGGGAVASSFRGRENAASAAAVPPPLNLSLLAQQQPQFAAGDDPQQQQQQLLAGRAGVALPPAWLNDERCFTADSGGMLSTRGDCIYYVGVIDILQEYNWWKRAETWIQGVRREGTTAPSKISSIDAKAYAERFVSFMDSLMI